MTSETNQEDTVTFASMGLPEPILRAVTDQGYETPTEIQARAIPALLSGRDVLGQAQTGTGKTAAFALPLLAAIEAEVRAPQMLVLAPTRELAMQVNDAITTYAKHLKGVRALPVYGGASMGVQLKGLKRGVQIVVGTPGRILDHLRRGTLILDQLRSFVLDEADEMLRMGFIEDVEEIISHTPEGRQVALFSATMPKQIRAISQRYLHDPETVAVSGDAQTIDTVRQLVWFVRGMSKIDALERLLSVEEHDGVLVFVRTRLDTERIAEALTERGKAAIALHGGQAQKARSTTVDQLRRGVVDLLITTDVAARGLDVERITHVVNFDAPHNAETYVHRIGRTGRAGRSGTSLLFVRPRERRFLSYVEKRTGARLEPIQMPSDRQIAETRVTAFRERIGAMLGRDDLDFMESLVAQIQQESGADLARVAAACARLAAGERGLRDPDSVPERPARSEREERRERPGREERSDRSDRGARPMLNAYTFPVGKIDGLQKSDMLQALFKEAGLTPRSVGDVRVHKTETTLEISDAVPDETVRNLEKIEVCGTPLKLRPTARRPKPPYKGGRPHRGGGGGGRFRKRFGQRGRR